MNYRHCLVGVFVGIVLIAPSTAFAHTNCETYGNYTVLQWQTNQLQKCGFTGPLWEGKLEEQINWCKEAESVEPLKRLRERRIQLLNCINSNQ